MEIDYCPDEKSTESLYYDIDTPYIGIEMVCDDINNYVIISTPIILGVVVYNDKFYNSLKKLLTDKNIVKICVDGSDKINYYKHQFNFEITSVVDLNTLSISMRCPEKGVDELYYRFCSNGEISDIKIPNELKIISNYIISCHKLLRIYHGMFRGSAILKHIYNQEYIEKEKELLKLNEININKK